MSTELNYNDTRLTNNVTRKGGKSVEQREMTELEAAIEILKDIKEAADKGIMWRDPNLYPEEYRKNYELVVSAIMGKAIATLEGLPPEVRKHQA